MSSDMIQLLVLAGIAVFLILRLKNVLGTREGFEKPPVPMAGPSDVASQKRQNFEVIEGGPDRDITDHVDEGSESAKALADMKSIDADFGVTDFLGGARGAYEMILMAFENGEIEDVREFLSEEVFETFEEVINMRKEQNVTIEASFVGVREVSLLSAELDRDTREGELKVRFIGELTSVVRNADGEIIEGNPNEIKKQKDVWTFARIMGSDDPNWQLVATGE